MIFSNSCADSSSTLTTMPSPPSAMPLKVYFRSSPLRDPSSTSATFATPSPTRPFASSRIGQSVDVRYDKFFSAVPRHSYQFILLGAVPFRRDVPRLQKLGVHGVVTLNEPFETLVPSSMYQSRGIDHLVIPTRDYMFAPSIVDINQAIDFIHRNTSCGRMTYIHCKAGRGRSTTIVLCYLVKYKNMTPTTAFEYVRSKRARVLLTRSQWKVVQEFSTKVVGAAAASPSGDVVLSTEDGSGSPGVIKEDASLFSHKTTPSRPMMKMLSCLLPSPVRSGDSLSHADLHA